MCQGCPVSGSLEHDLEASLDPASPTSLWGEGTSSICLFWGWGGVGSGWGPGTPLSGLSQGRQVYWGRGDDTLS